MRGMSLKLGIAAIAAATLGGCGGDNGGTAAATPSPSVAQSLNTAQVLAQAREASETSTAYSVNDGVVVLSDTSDHTEPLAVDLTGS